MEIKIKIRRSFAKLAVQHALRFKIKISSRQKFVQCVIDYLEGYGQLCVDDHEGEYREFEENAEAITNKYYN